MVMTDIIYLRVSSRSSHHVAGHVKNAPVFSRTRPLDILVQLLPEVILELRAKVGRMKKDGMRQFTLLSETKVGSTTRHDHNRDPASARRAPCALGAYEQGRTCCSARARARPLPDAPLRHPERPTRQQCSPLPRLPPVCAPRWTSRGPRRESAVLGVAIAWDGDSVDDARSCADF